MTNDLKSCPFCGGDAITDCFGGISIRCSDCGVQIRGNDVAAAWNLRASAELAEHVEAERMRTKKAIAIKAARKNGMEDAVLVWRNALFFMADEVENMAGVEIAEAALMAAVKRIEKGDTMPPEGSEDDWPMFHLIFDKMDAAIRAAAQETRAMTDRANLLALADRCEAASGPDFALGVEILRAVGRTGIEVNPLFSLDAALLLVPNGWRVTSADWSIPGQYRWMLKGPRLKRVPNSNVGWDAGDAWFIGAVSRGGPALALTAAALRALAHEALNDER